MGELAGKVAVVTGAARGIGRGCALALARRGARVAVNDLPRPESLSQAEETARECREAGGAAGGDGLACPADVSDPAAVDALFDRVLERWGRVDILVNNAFRTVRKPFLELEPDDLRATWDVSLLAPFYCSRQAARQMVRQGEGGKIVMISSVLAFIPYPNSLPYNTAKAGLEQMAFTMAAELAPHRINVNVVEPGWTDTPGERAFLSEEELQAEGRKLPWGRLGTIQELGEAVAYLCSPAAEYVTAALLRVDGGYWLPRSGVSVPPAGPE